MNGITLKFASICIFVDVIPAEHYCKSDYKEGIDFKDLFIMLVVYDTLLFVKGE